MCKQCVNKTIIYTEFYFLQQFFAVYCHILFCVVYMTDMPSTVTYHKFFMYVKLKLASAIFYQIFIFHQLRALQKLWKMFISSKNLFSFLRYPNFCIFAFPSFFPGWFKKNLKVYDVINCLNKNLVTHFVWYLDKEIRCDIETLFIDRVLNTEHFYGKIMQKMCTTKS